MTAILYTKSRGVLLRSALCPTGADWNLSVRRPNVKAGISDETGALTNLEVMAPFLQHTLGDPTVWAEQDSLVRDTTARLFLQGFVRFYLAVKFPLANHGRPLRIVIVSAKQSKNIFFSTLMVVSKKNQ